MPTLPPPPLLLLPSINEARVDATAEIHEEVKSLASLRLLQQVSSAENLDVVRYKVRFYAHACNMHWFCSSGPCRGVLVVQRRQSSLSHPLICLRLFLTPKRHPRHPHPQ